MKIINTKKAAQALGHYSQAIVQNNFVFVSGQIPIDPNDGSIPEGIEAQTHLALSNLKAILEEAKSSLDKVVKITLFITDIMLWPRANEVYAQVFGQHRPARSAVPVVALPKGVLVEIEAIAVLL